MRRKGESENGLQKNKARQIFRKTNISYPLICTRIRDFIGFNSELRFQQRVYRPNYFLDSVTRKANLYSFGNSRLTKNLQKKLIKEKTNSNFDFSQIFI